MAKKKKNTPIRFSSDLGPAYKSYNDLEKMIRKEYQRNGEMVKAVYNHFPKLLNLLDYDDPWLERRVKATSKYAAMVQKMIEPICPDIEDSFYIQEEWAKINSRSIESYDIVNWRSDVLTGAALWVLDRLEESRKVYSAIDLIRDVDTSESGSIDFYDPCYDTETIISMRAVLADRNTDCKGYRGSRREIFDPITVTQKNHQDVPSRRRYEAILDLLGPDVINTAVAHYEEKMWLWVRTYFQYLKPLAQERAEVEEKSDDELFSTVERLSQQKRAISELSLNPYNALNNPKTLVQGAMDKESVYKAQVREIEKRMLVLMSMIGNLDEAAEYEEAESIAEELYSTLTVSDPYEMCFAALYMADTGNEILGLHYPGVSVLKSAASALPWRDMEYDEDEDIGWHPELAGKKPTAIPDYPDMYSRDYKDEEGTRTNLAQIVYNITGNLLPRNLHRYDAAIPTLRRYGVTGKKIQLPLLMSMTILGEVSRQKTDLNHIMDFSSDYSWMDEDEEEEQQSREADTGEETEAQQPNDLDLLKAENDRLRKAAHEFQVQIRELQTKLDSLQEKNAHDRRELSDLREIVYNMENGIEEAEPEEELDWPYSVRKNTVVFGGHDTWAKAIRPLLTGNIRFVDRERRPDTDLIRNADVVWIQTNCISHPTYWKVTETARSHNVAIRYFTNASALKGAIQIRESDG